MKNYKSGFQYLNTLNIIYYALLSGGLIFFFVSYLKFQKAENIPAPSELGDIFAYLVPIICVLQTAMGYFIFHSQLKKLSTESLEEKLSQFQRSFLVQMALFEAASLFAVVSYYLTASNAFALWFGIMYVVMNLNRPTARRIVMYLRLNEQETQWLQSR